eukprot:scaffold36293_cov196-Isochrysis_galbana.AAC.1
MDENTTIASSGDDATACCKPHAPCTFGAYTRLIVADDCVRSKPSLSTPAACQTPARRALPLEMMAHSIERVSAGSAASHLTTRKSQATIFFSLSPSATATLPPRAASTTEAAPLVPSHFPVTNPRPPVPPESRWVPRGAMGF